MHVTIVKSGQRSWSQPTSGHIPGIFLNKLTSVRIKTRNFLNTSLGTTIRLTYLRSQGYGFKLVIRETGPSMHTKLKWFRITSHGGICCSHYFNLPNPKRTYKQSEKLNIRNNRSEQVKVEVLIYLDNIDSF